MLFDDTERHDASPASHTEDSFSFLNRNSGPVWTRIRNELEVWYSDYPDADGDVKARFRDRAPAQHFAAWWELYLHHIFSQFGYSVEVHPELQGSSDRPDFLISDGENAFYLEALTAFSGIVDEGRHGAREAEMLEAIEGLEKGIWFLRVNFDRVGSSSPRRATVRQQLQSWLAGFDPDVVIADMEAGLPFPATKVKVGDWVLDVEAFPVATEHRGAQDQPVIGVGPMIVGYVNDYEKIGAALRRKRARYRQVTKPLVLALFSTSTLFEVGDVARILFGTMTAYYAGPGVSTHQARVPDGLWTEKAKRPGRHISALLVGTFLTPNSFVDRWPTLWLNPWADRPFEARVPFSQSEWLNGSVQQTDAARSVRDVLALPPHWPGPEPTFGERRIVRSVIPD